ncbi:MAG: DMT family transporter [Rickettsiaceae bacterium]
MNTRFRSYCIGIFWFLLSGMSSSINDIISKYIGMRLHSYEITFFRFMFGTLTLLPFIPYYGYATLKTSRPIIHFFRGLLLFFGIAGWTYGLTLVPVTTVTVVSFTVPIFVLILGVFFLKERILWQRWFVTIVACAGLVITLEPTAQDFNPEVLVLLSATIAFAALDIINKKFIIKETMISMLFYSALITALLALPFAIKEWVQPNTLELGLLFLLGASANLILFFLLKAFAATDATALAPYRYFELVVSAIIAYLVFQEIPKDATILGSCIIIPATLFVIYSEKKEFAKGKKSTSTT